MGYACFDINGKLEIDGWVYSRAKFKKSRSIRLPLLPLVKPVRATLKALLCS
jgi:hypothetical protein